jgi:hypothetical protein
MAISKIPSAGFQDNVKFRNIIINGDMSIAQRGTSFAAVNDDDYTLDRFKYDISGTDVYQFTISQDTDVPTGQGFAKSMKFDCTTADASLDADNFAIIHTKIEGQNLQYLKKGTSNAESTTLSFWVKSNKTGTYIAELQDEDNNRVICKSYTVSSSSTGEKKTITFAGDTTGAFGNDNGSSLRVNFWLLAGTGFSSGTLATSWETRNNVDRAVGQVNLGDSTSNEWYITGVQLEAGEVASDFEFLPRDINLNRCLRYCFSEPQGDTYHNVLNGFYSSTTLFIGCLNLPVKMRSTPTLTTSGSWSCAGTTGLSASNFQLIDVALDEYSSVEFRATVSGATAGQGARFRNANDTSATFILSAEL